LVSVIGTAHQHIEVLTRSMVTTTPWRITTITVGVCQQ